MPGDASRVLLDAVSLGVERGERIGVVGLNGGGKTTLLDILAGRREPQGGRVSRVGGLNMTHLAQGDALPPGARVRDVVLARYGAEHEWAADPKVRDVLNGLGLAREAQAERSRTPSWTGRSTDCPAARSAAWRSPPP